ncbi:hypothetical protein [Curtobacterium sp. PhB115]|uniref:hypothetical protein n=1 Tax=Curtobacterium sp. PhB115 TaxID=2485173 RepID=UPI000F4CB0F3|nr:hypothetical protein [Curtobacterium sp. PhB115]ROP64335.1 hypothetical protein EDF19_2800 [Curtobacterium sp. PhB115]
MQSIQTDPDRRRRRPFRTSLALVAALAVAVSGLTFGTMLTTTESASAATASDFDPGNIISDANFYNGSAMSAAAVQSFLGSVAPNCKKASGGPACLKDFSQKMSAISAVSGRCSAIAGGTKSAATMIAQVGAACGISQKVLLVLLQKEQGIVTTSSPTSYMYLHATGFACPDTAPCDPAYYGFGQQVYAAALQFKRYQASPTSWAYQAGRNNSILLNPNAACGRKTVYIQNQATAGLYIYTPYTPNTAAMSNLYGTGDSCSAYGNRNFWRMYTDWFGSATGNGSPTGNVDAVTATSPSSITVTGWAVDPDTTNALRVAFYVDGAGAKTVTANKTRSDLAGSLGSGNTAHGFATELTGLSLGAHSVCTYAINQGKGANTLLGCYTRTITSAAPKGVLDSVTGGVGTITASGWVLDPDSAKPAPWKILVDGVSKATGTADRTRTDVAKVYSGVGSTLGFSKTIGGITPGTRAVTLYTMDKPGTKYVKVASKSVFVDAPTTGKTGKTGALRGSYDSVTGGVGTATVRGWAIDPDVWDPVKYKIHVDGVSTNSGSADATRTDVEAQHPTWGSDVGLTLRLTGLQAGKHTVRVYFQELPSGKYVSFGTKTVTVTAASTTDPSAPGGTTGKTGKTGAVTGAYESVTGGVHKATVRGWAIDPDVWDPVAYKIHVDGVAIDPGVANAKRTDVEAVHPSWGSDVGLSLELTGLSTGTHTVRVYFQDLPSGTYKSFGTKSVTVTDPPTTGKTGSTGSVKGAFESVTGGKGTIVARGWAVDPDVWDPVKYKIHLDGVAITPGTVNSARTDVQKVYPDWGSDVGLYRKLTGLKAGKHTVRIYYQDLPSGTYKSFGTKTVTVQ